MAGKRGKKKKNPAAKRFSVYVIELDEQVLESKKFREANPDRAEGKGCLYVGMTALSPEARFAQHKTGVKSGKFVRQYGRWLRKRLYQAHNPMTYDDAKRMEAELARRLRKRGYAVWWN